MSKTLSSLKELIPLVVGKKQSFWETSKNHKLLACLFSRDKK